MTIEQANEYFSSLPEGFAPAEELRAALTADVQKVQFVGVAGTAGKTAAAGLLAAILREAAFHVGFYRAGCEPLSARIAIGGVSVKSFGSQGQTRTAAISLKLAERALFYADTGEEPVLMLDDVLSELDPGRQDFVLNQIRTGQVFITCCETEKWTAIGKTLVIQDGTIRE